jgi:alanyl-tRNA synthetase
MATSRIYYDAPLAQVFDATVVRVETRGPHTGVWLDRTAFYPTSGGQPFDTGTLAGATVVGVEEDDDGDVVHLVAGTLPQVGAPAYGVIDWQRRFDHMQQHTGQHLLSAVLEHAFDARTVSFHLGAETSTIDVDRELTAAQLAQAEREVNAVIWRDLPVSIRYVSADEARALPLRKESARTGTLRLIEIQGVDLSACGGTHVGATGAIGQVILAGWERFKGGQRIEFVCGGRALLRAQQIRDACAASTRLLSVSAEQLPATIERLQSDLKDQRKAIAGLQAALAQYEAGAMADAAEALGGTRAVLQRIDGDAPRLKELATAIAARPGLVVVLVSSSTPALAIAARSADASVSCQALVAALIERFDGRGGGKADLAQCGALQASADEILAFVRARLSAGS